MDPGCGLPPCCPQPGRETACLAPSEKGPHFSRWDLFSRRSWSTGSRVPCCSQSGTLGPQGPAIPPLLLSSPHLRSHAPQLWLRGWYLALDFFLSTGGHSVSLGLGPTPPAIHGMWVPETGPLHAQKHPWAPQPNLLSGSSRSSWTWATTAGLCTLPSIGHSEYQSWPRKSLCMPNPDNGHRRNENGQSLYITTGPLGGSSCPLTGHTLALGAVCLLPMLLPAFPWAEAVGPPQLLAW